MTEREMAELAQDAAEWEALERAAGLNPNDLDYPPDIDERIDRMWEDEGDELRAAITKDEEAERPDRCDCHPDGRCGASPGAGA